MITRHLVDPELLPLIDSLPSVELTTGSLPLDRAGMLALMQNLQLPDLRVDSSELHVPSDDGGRTIRCLMVKPEVMVANLCLIAQDKGEYSNALQHLEASRLEDRLTAPEDDNPYTGEFVWRRPNSAFCSDAYLGEGNASPYIAVGSIDLFVDECLAYSTRLIRSGVPIELIVYPGCTHGFKMASEATVAKRAEVDNINALRRALSA